MIRLLPTPTLAMLLVVAIFAITLPLPVFSSKPSTSSPSPSTTPPPGVFFDIPDFLHTPLSHLGPSLKHSGRYESPDGRVKLHHDVEFHPTATFVELDRLGEELVKVTVHDSPADVTTPSCSVELEFYTHEAAVSFIEEHGLATLTPQAHDPKSPLLILGGLQHGHTTSIMKKSTSSTSVKHSDKEVKISNLGQAHYNDVFKNARISFAASKFPDDHFETSHYDTSKQTANYVEGPFVHPANSNSNLRGRRKLWFGWGKKIFNSIWNGIKHVAKAVETVVKTVVTVVEVLVTGDYDAHETIYHKEFSWNTNDGGKSASGDVMVGKVKCGDCYMHAEIEFRFDLVINDYDVELAQLVGEGEYVVSAQSQVTVEGGTITDEVQASTVNMGSVHFMIGPVPVVLSATVPIHVGYEISMSSDATFTVGARFSGHAQYGFKYTDRFGFEAISDSNFEHSGGITDINVPDHLGAMIYVKPVMVIQVEHIGGPDIGLKTFLEYVLEKGTDDVWTTPCANQPKLSFNAGIQGTIGAHVNIMDIVKKEFPSRAIFSIKKPILSGCITGYNELTSSSPLLSSPSSPTSLNAVHRVIHPSGKILSDPIYTNDGTSYGTTWYGTYKRTGSNPKCSSFPEYRTLAVQNVDATKIGSDPIIDVVIASSDSQNYDDRKKDFCTRHTIWSWGGRGGMIMMEPRSDDDFEEYVDHTVEDSSDSSCLNEASISTSRYYGTYTSDMARVELTDSLGCTTIVLERVMEGTTQWALEERRRGKLME
ncbi:hypothetical protein TrST_g3339 [Triparma strigata]|uniref:Uncharacterized protein n=1 Tax=Triparma strigata TaxID=1606541 RepID=A0A9W7E7M4_9STRA|nr:hypothetical protein TrST_g3339 [Triparma strigata]